QTCAGGMGTTHRVGGRASGRSFRTGQSSVDWDRLPASRNERTLQYGLPTVRTRRNDLMPLQDIQLDDRRFDSLMQEAKRRIPRYTREWTDHSESDPGITLLELFAWLTEMMLYRINRVPEKNYVKFLQLIGIELNPPTPAHADLTFTLTTTSQPIVQVIPQGTRVSLSDQTDGGPVVFETDANLYATNAELKAIQAFDGGQFELLTELNNLEGKFFYPFGKYPQKGSALYLGFSQPFPE